MTGYESKRAATQDKLTQPAAPEVWMFQHDETGRVTCILNDGINTPELFLEMNPRYALIGSPNSLKRQPLTDEQIEDIAAKTMFPINFARAIEAQVYKREWVGLTFDEKNNARYITDWKTDYMAAVIEYIEAKLKEKNT
jgi:hypothetical protein